MRIARDAVRRFLSSHMATGRATNAEHVRAALKLAVCVLLFGSAASCDASSHVVGGDQLDSARDHAISTYALVSDLPKCNPSRGGAVYYVNEEDAFYYCDGRAILPVDLAGQAGKPGTSWLTVTSEANVAACSDGGVMVHAGPDDDMDGVLGASEVVSTAAVCNGEQGPRGERGAEGLDGRDGQDGRAQLIETTEAMDQDCPNGGVVLAIGFDSDESGSLGQTEIEVRRVLCNGDSGPGGRNSLITTAPATDAQCPAGGLVIRVGLDDDADGMLDGDEVDATELMCGGGESGTCSSPFDDCNGDVADGCETDLRSDVMNCGGCGVSCPEWAYADVACQLGQCRVAGCDTRRGDCNGVPIDGCETDTWTDTNNCGQCGLRCPTGVPFGEAGCWQGACRVISCAAGRADCNSFVADGCETNTQSDVNNCGGCGSACSGQNAIETCSGGACSISSCTSGYADCDLNARTGCEFHMRPADVTCVDAAYAGAEDGDAACGLTTCSQRGFSSDPFAIRTGTGSAWYWATIREDSACDGDLWHILELQAPAGAEYALLLYSTCGGVPVAQSIGAGIRNVTLTVPDELMSDETQSYWVEVRYVNGASCQPWTLRFYGRPC